MAAYLTKDQFKVRSTMPAAFVDALDTREPGFVDSQLVAKSSWINSRLRKRYLAPFADPAPDIVLDWLTRLVTPFVWHKRGHDPTDESYKLIETDSARAEDEIKEAANAVDGLFDLPLRDGQSNSDSGIAKGFPRAYSEQSPYAAGDVQARNGRFEDQGGNGGQFR